MSFSLILYCLIFLSDINLISLNEPVNSAPSKNQVIIFKEGFEQDSIMPGIKRQMSSLHSFVIVNKPVYKGNSAGKFRLKDTDRMVSNGTRAEFLFGVPESNERWYSFAAYFPEAEYKPDSNNDILNQWHQKGSPATSFRIKNNNFFLRVGNTKESREEFYLGSVTRDVWHKFVFHIIHSHHNDGLIEVWHNGKKVLTHKGGNMYDAELPRWKIGIYKDNWNDNRTTDTNLREYYVDDIKIGNEKANLLDM